jgi:FkbM family methyltransferase
MKKNGSGVCWWRNLADRITGHPLAKGALREPLYLEMLGHGLGQGPVTMVSIGSSDGVECMYALRLKGRDVTVHLLEPDPVNLETCRRNLSRRFPKTDQIHFHNLAVSNRIDVGSFFRNPDSPNLNSASPFGGASQELPVRYVTLDHFLENNRIQATVIVNMDIEGHEIEVLEGFFGFASANRGVKILMEVHPSLYTEQHSLENVLKKYFAAGYQPAYVESAGLPVPEKFKERSLTPLKVIKDRGLYAGLDPAFVLDVACHENLNPIDPAGRVTRKIVRSLLIERN